MYLITPDCDDDSWLSATLNTILACRPACLQYRNKTLPPVRRLSQARQVQALCQKYQIPLIVNDDILLAKEINADGVHLGRDDDNIHQARSVLGERKIIGISCYNELPRALEAANQHADYVAFGAMFASATKPEATHAPLSLLTEARTLLDVPIVAIGGITLDNVSSVLRAGADAVAVISDVFSAASPVEQVQRYQQRIAHHHD